MKVFYKIKQLLSNWVLKVRSLITRTPELVKNNVPYISQFANPAWAEMVIKDDQPLARDLMWEESGARSIKEYERWALATCGMACTAMILAFFNKGSFQTIPLARDAAKHGVYKKEADNSISSMHYQPYTKWIKKYDLAATTYTGLSFRSIRTLLSSGSLIIASVNPNIRGFNTAPATQVGGHLVLVTGYNKKDETITFHNPSGFENNQSQVNHTVPVKEWVIYFAGRGIAVKS